MNGIHGLPTLSNGRRLWAGNLGRPVSYGCIILDLPAAEWLYDWAQNGVVVEIRE
jgi:lipoprotein-anchoring transpeptidase ErfK/SrfK